MRRLAAAISLAGLALVMAIAGAIRIAVIPRAVRDDPYPIDPLPVLPPTEAELAFSRETRRGT
jgi:hypothetical protein